MNKTEYLYELFQKHRKVSTDTRSIGPGSLFFALKGPKFNANQFAEEALKAGASYAIIDDEAFEKGDQFIIVDDTLKALQQLARFHRDQLKIPVIGLTGSNGKTTTKELLAVTLGTKYKTSVTKGNLNNHIGVPLTLLEIDDSIEMAVIEMGANHVGEIALLCELANPTHGLITNIGRAHIGTFGGFENIVRGKSELYQHLLSNGGTVFVNSKDDVLAQMATRFESPVFYPCKEDDYCCEFLDANPFLRFRAENGTEVQTHIIGAYNFQNIAAALCVAEYFDVDPDAANQAVADYVPGNMRSQWIQQGSNTILLDAYNANPSSMEVALEMLNQLKADKKVVILGDMYDLEDQSEQEHRKLGGLIANKKINKVYLCGPLMKPALLELPGALHFDRKQDLIEELKKNPISDATILVKASRGIGLETLLEFL